jgi:hypothetical protein
MLSGAPCIAAGGSCCPPPPTRRDARPAALPAPHPRAPAQRRRRAFSSAASRSPPRPPALSAAAEAATAAEEQAADSGQALSSFLSWLVANGVEGVGAPGAPAALYEGENGERGLVAVAPVAAGAAVLKVPLRLAITDDPDDEESNALVYEGAPWSVRLAARLLRLEAAGADCPWLPYLAALPRAVPSPVACFSWADVQAIGYDPMRRQLDAASWLAGAAAGALSPAAAGGRGRAALERAMALVHSRTFASAGRRGGAGVRMMVPLVDMLNHAGDVAGAPPGAPDPRPLSADNVRWDVVGRVGGEFFMVSAPLACFWLPAPASAAGG